MNDSYDSLFEEAGRKYNVDPRLLKTVFHLESGGNPDIGDSEAGAQGGMQILPSTAKMLGVDPKNFPQAVDGAARYLAEGLDKTGTPEGALAYYHGGPNQAQWGPRTAAYVAQGSGMFPNVKMVKGQPVAQTDVAGDDLLKAYMAEPSETEGVLARLRKQQSQSTGPAPDMQDAPKSDDAGGALLDAFLAQPDTTSQKPDSFLDRARAAMAPNPDAGEILPLAGDATKGTLRPAIPNALLTFGRGVVDLLKGVDTGTVTPEATMALTMMPGMLRGPGMSALRSPAVAPENKLTAAAEAPKLSQEFTVNPLTDAARQKVEAGLLPRGPSQPVPKEVTQPAPAVATAPIPDKLPAPPTLPIRTQKGAEAEADRIIRHFAQGGPTDLTTAELVAGNKPRLSQATGNAGIATLERGIRDMAPNAFVTGETARAANRNQAFMGIAGTASDVAAAEAYRDSATSAARNAAFANAQPVDAAPVVAKIDEILASPAGKRDAVVTALKNIRSKLVDGEGNVESNPEQLYGVRKAIDDVISPVTESGRAAGAQAGRELITLKGALDDVIESGAPGFKDYISDYSAMSQPITGMKYLQGLNLTNPKGEIMPGKLDAALKAIERQRSQPGAKPADALTDSQLERLKAIRDDLNREAKSQAGRSLGSNTFQNLGVSSTMAAMNNPLIGAVTHGIGVAGGGLPGFVASNLLTRGLNAADAKSRAMVLEALREKLLSPEKAASAFAPARGTAAAK